MKKRRRSTACESSNAMAAKAGEKTHTHTHTQAHTHRRSPGRKRKSRQCCMRARGATRSVESATAADDAWRGEREAAARGCRRAAANETEDDDEGCSSVAAGARAALALAPASASSAAGARRRAPRTRFVARLCRSSPHATATSSCSISGDTCTLHACASRSCVSRCGRC